ncbi:hypothetical protein ACRALDRAFT_1067162 [Sodiomyces alcalophilus JCM 7366]|uniref:uncharacterized protein n=1 Tax=Sodiomyces alcalophilus JCM 7366 TaxID=591952 RepID=UPI0039B5D502
MVDKGGYRMASGEAIEKVYYDGQKATKALQALENIWVKRDLILREPKELNLSRPSNREAVMMTIVGTAAPTECKSCTKKDGPFDGCFVVPGVARGSCNNCHWNSEGIKCSFRPPSANVDDTPAPRKPTTTALFKKKAAATAMTATAAQDATTTPAQAVTMTPAPAAANVTVGNFEVLPLILPPSMTNAQKRLLIQTFQNMIIVLENSLTDMV